VLYEHYLDLAAELDELIAALEAHPDEATREQFVGLLQRVDLLHREGLLRLVEAMRAAGASAALDRATEDPVVRIFLGLYGLADLGVEERAPASTDGFVPIERLAVRRTRVAAASDPALPEEER
jgi:hypothetical protein